MSSGTQAKDLVHRNLPVPIRKRCRGLPPGRRPSGSLPRGTQPGNTIRTPRISPPYLGLELRDFGVRSAIAMSCAVPRRLAHEASRVQSNFSDLDCGPRCHTILELHPASRTPPAIPCRRRPLAGNVHRRPAPPSGSRHADDSTSTRLRRHHACHPVLSSSSWPCSSCRRSGYSARSSRRCCGP